MTDDDQPTPDYPQDAERLAALLSSTAAAAGVAVEEVAQWGVEEWELELARVEALLRSGTGPYFVRRPVDTDSEVAAAAFAHGWAACEESLVCGCPLEVEIEDDGSPVVGTERVVHGCGR